MSAHTFSPERQWAMVSELALRTQEERLAQLRGAATWPTAPQLQAFRQEAAASLAQVGGKVAVVPVYGVIEHRCSEYSYYFGGAGAEQLGQCLDRLAASADVEAIVLDVDSPGGEIDGVQELADKIYSLRAVKPIYAVCNTLMASAAFWLGSQASQVLCTPSGFVGSVGVFLLHVEYSKADAEHGVTITIVSAGEYKTEGNDAEPLAPEAKARMQELVNATYGDFVAAVNRGRGKTSSDKWGAGRVLRAKEALAGGLIDKVVSLDGLLASLGGDVVSRNDRMFGSVEKLRLRHEQQKRRTAAALLRTGWTWPSPPASSSN